MLKLLPLRMRLGRFAGWWMGTTSLYAASGGPCPCCGKPGCPVGLAAAGVVGAAFAWTMTRLKSFRTSREDDSEI